MVHAEDTYKKTMTLQSIPVMNEFPMVFSDDPQRIPPKRGANFVIDFLLEMQPILIPPYRKAPTELREWKEQLKDLFNKGFIRLSTSLWGAQFSLLE